MKKTRKPRWMMIQLLICLALILGTVVLLALMSERKKTADTTPPAITFSSENVEYILGEETSVLLAGVTAKDDTDGDVTASVRIRNISISEDSTKAVVSYVAKDLANNMALEKRIVDVRIIEPEEEPQTETEKEPNDEPETEPEKKNETDEQS